MSGPGTTEAVEIPTPEPGPDPFTEAQEALTITATPGAADKVVVTFD